MQDTDLAVFGTPSAPYAFLGEDGDLAVKWGTDRLGASGGNVTYSMNLAGINGLTGLALAAFEQAIDLAFLTWSSIANIVFEEVSSGADIAIRADEIDQGGTSEGNVLGYMSVEEAFLASSSDLYAIFDSVAIVFDDFETWDPSTDGMLDFFAVALHEIGHALGLGHVPNIEDGGTLQNMNPFISTDEVQGGDVAGIVALYGEREYDGGVDIVNFTKVNVSQTIFAKGGSDNVNGSDLADNIYGGFGNDTLFGNGGDDLLVDTRGDNDIDGGDGGDTIIGGTGSIDAEGNEGNDLLVGGVGDDILDGGSGNDTLRGDPSGSFISGDDRLIAGSGNDILEGGGGADTFVFDDTTGNNSILDFEIGVDVIELDGFDFTDGTLTDNGTDSFFTYNASGVDFDLTIEGVIISEMDFV